MKYLAALLGLGLVACTTATSDEDDDASNAQMGKIDARLPPIVGQPDFRVAPPLGDGGLDDARVVVPPSDGGLPADAIRPPPPDQGVAPGNPLVATIVLTEEPQADSASLSAAVSAQMELMTAPGCSLVDVDPNSAPPATPSFDAGAITVTGPNGGPYTLNLVPGGSYTAPGVPDNLFEEGALIQAQAVGGAHLGAFQVQVQAPAQVRMSDPPEFSFSPHPANRDLDVRWSPSMSESLVVSAFPVRSGFDPTPRAGRWLFCGADESGNLTIPGNQLSQVGSGGDSVLVVIIRTRISSTTIGPHEAYLTASTTTGALVTLQ